MKKIDAHALAGAAIDRALVGGPETGDRNADRDRGRSYVIDRVEMTTLIKTFGTILGR